MISPLRLIYWVGHDLSTDKKDAEKAVTVTQVFKVIEESLVANEKVQLVGFGTFEVRERAERIGRNPQTNESITIPASKFPGFKAGKALK